MISKTEKHLNHLIGKLIYDRQLIVEGDKILIGLSGGKDSWTLCYFLSKFQEKAPIKFSIAATTLNIGYTKEMVARFRRRLKLLKMDYFFVEAPIQQIINDKLIPGTSTCSLCARMRRAFLYKAASDFGFNKIALGHHKDDFVETLMMNMFYHGTIKGMPAILKEKNGVHELIRPLLTCDEQLIIKLSKEKRLPVVACPCGKCDLASKDRMRMKLMLRELEKKTKGVRTSIQSAAQNIIADHMF